MDQELLKDYIKRQMWVCKLFWGPCWNGAQSRV
jgi:hypothetical protein